MDYIDNIAIGSMNVRGLAGNEKRRDVFKWLRGKKLSIYCLQDVHFLKKYERIIEAEWGYKCVFSSYRSDARGVAVLFNNNFEFKIHKVRCDATGNFVAIDIETERLRFTLLTLYGPNTDSPEFYNNINEILGDFENLSMVICGDWNMVQSFELDTSGYRTLNNPKARDTVLELIAEHDLVDPWRESYPTLRRYTWRRRVQSGVQQGRLDFFLVSQDLYSQMYKTRISPGYRTDHSLVILELVQSKQERGKGFWKFNAALLRDRDYVFMVKETIKDVLELYLKPGYRIEDENAEFNIDDQLLFEALKLEIRGRTVAYCAKEKRERQDMEQKLEQTIQTYETAISEDPTNEDILNLLGTARQDLQDSRKTKVAGAMIRSKARWVEHGEKPSKYFCKLEERNYTSKTIHKLDIDGRQVTDSAEIRLQQASFYEKLYTQEDPGNADTDYFLNDSTIKNLSPEEQAVCEGLLTGEELKFALQNMANGKSPGSDGFTTEFYKFFWGDIGKYCTKSLNYAFERGELSVTQKQGVITCLPKGNKPREFLKNWRPITLLNIDYKLLSACLAARMKMVLPQIISDNQKGFLAGRFIGENTRLVYDLMNYLNRKNKSGLLLLIDFEKAFDTIRWSYIEKVLYRYNFGPMFIHWWKTCYKNSNSCVINNGHFSQFFQMGRGCRQGDPLSPYLFILAIEPLAVSIKLSKECKGVEIEGKIFKIGQYADDTFLMLDGTEKSLRTAISIFDKFRYVSGLKMNPTKTQAVWIGTKAGSDAVLCPDKHLNWTCKFTLLGINFDTKNLDNLTEINLESKIHTIRKLLASYKRRNLTVIGKITVVKSLALPKLVHVFASLPEPPEKLLSQLRSMFERFIWGDKTAKVNRNLLSQDLSDGGLKMTNIKMKIHSLKIAWIKRLTCKEGDWQILFYTEHDSNIWELDKRSLQQYSKLIHNPFWKEVCRDWAECVDEPQTASEILATPLWNTYFLTSYKLKLSKQTLMNQGCNMISDIVNENNKFLTYQEFKTKFNIDNITFLDYQALIYSIPKSWRRVLRTDDPAGEPENKFLLQLRHSPNPSNWAYGRLMKKLPYRDKQKDKWDTILQCTITQAEWREINLCANHCTVETKLRMFHYKIVHRFLATNYYLKKVKIKDADLCDHCGRAVETSIHLFWECEYAQSIWRDLRNWLATIYDIGPLLNARNILLGAKIPTHHRLLNHIFLLAKWHIYSSKYQNIKPSFNHLQRVIMQHYIIEKSISSHNDQMKNVFEKKWMPDFVDLLHSMD